jgi:hypothetical protein
MEVLSKGAIGRSQDLETGPREQKMARLDSQSTLTLWPARPSMHLQATLVSCFYKDATYECLQAAEMARPQAVRRKSGGRILVTDRLISPLI